MNDIWSLIFYINEEKYTLNNTNDTFLYEFKEDDILKIIRYMPRASKPQANSQKKFVSSTRMIRVQTYMVS